MIELKKKSFSSYEFLLPLNVSVLNTGFTKRIRHVSDVKFIGNAVDKEGRFSYDLFVLWSHDAKRDVLARSSGK